MFIETKHLYGALMAALMFASTDETRAHLNCVHFEVSGAALRIASTDGHTLWCCEVPVRDVAENPGTVWNVPVQEAFIIARRLSKFDRAEVSVDLARRELGGYEYKHAGDFARIEHVIPALEVQESPDPKRVLPEFAAAYVMRACEALRLYGKGFAPEIVKKGTKEEKQASRDARDAFLDPPMAWRCGDEFGPAYFYSPKFPAAFAILMPRKGAGNNSVSIAKFVESIRCGKARAA